MSSLRRDLFERRLWPIVVVLIAAIVAVPFLLTGHSHRGAAALADASRPVPAATTTSSTTTTGHSGSGAAVPRRGGRSANPFALTGASTSQGATGTTGSTARTATSGTVGSVASTGLGGTTATTGTTTSATAPVSGSSTTSTTTTGGSAGTTTTTTTTTKTGSDVTGNWTVYGLSVRYKAPTGHWQGVADIARYTPLPAADWPKLMFIGVANGGRNGVFALGAGVTAAGKALCRPSNARCTLISLPVGGVERVSWLIGADQQRTLNLTVTRATKQVFHRKALMEAAVGRHSQIGLCELELGDPIVYHLSSTGQLQGTSNAEPACTKAIRKTAIAFPGTSSQTGAVASAGAIALPGVTPGA